jgi:hypothetical protein
MDKYIIETEATVIEIEGEKWLIVLNTFNYGSPEAKHLASEEIWRLRGSYHNLVTGVRRPDGTYEFACPPVLQEKIRIRILPNQPWKKVRLYPPPDLPSKRNEP